MSASRPLILASASPARSRLLTQIGIPFIQLPTNTDESGMNGPAEALTAELSRRKLESCLNQNSYAKEHPVLSADTVVCLNGEIIGKPSGRHEASEFLARLSGNTHRVVSSFSLYIPVSQGVFSETCITEVSFHNLSDDEITWYLETGEWEHAAGAYRIQGRGALLIREVNGSFWNIVGLPIEQIFGIVRRQECLHVVFGP